jgi:hypothetical protein
MKLQKYLQTRKNKISEIQTQINRFEAVQAQFPKLKLEVKDSKIDFSQSNILFHCRTHKLQKYLCSQNPELMTHFLVGHYESKLDQVSEFNIFPYFCFQQERIFLNSCFRYHHFQLQFLHPDIKHLIKFDQKLKELKLSPSLELDILSFCHSTRDRNNVPFSEFLSRY